MPIHYQPLGDYLAAQPPEAVQVTLTLPQIEALLGEPLPRAASTAQWWSNTPRFRHAAAWLRAGWSVTARSFRLAEPTITFAREALASARRPFAPP